MRAFRPSRFSPAEEYDEDDQRIKAANLERYAKRAEKGQALFGMDTRRFQDEIALVLEGA